MRATAPPALDRRYLELIAQSRVIQVMTAGKRDQPVVEELGHGVFTRKLLDGLAGHADENRDGIVTVGELAAWMHPRVAQASDYMQDMQWGTLDGEGQVVFVLPDSARIASGDQTTRLQQEQQRLVEERARVEAERRRRETERSRLETALPPPTAVDPLARGRLLFDLDLKRQPRGPDLVVYLDGAEAARASDASLARGRVELAFGRLADSFQVQVRSFRVWALSGR